MSSRPFHRRAFTLVEIMLSIALLSMVVGAVYATWSAILRASRASQIAAAQIQRTRVALNCLEQSLTYAQMFTANARYYSFEAENGSDASLSFVAHLPESFPRSGRFGELALRRVWFKVESSPDGGRQLVLRQAPLLLDFDEDERQHPLVLMQNVKRMEMVFWDAQKKDWIDEWLQTNQMPKLIRVTMTVDNPRLPYDRGEEYVRTVAPAAVAVQPNWQSSAGGGAPPPPGQPPPPIAPPGIKP